MEALVLARRRDHLETCLLKDEYNYDLWFDYIRLEEQATEIDKDRIKQLYRRATFLVPLGNQKEHWRRYIYLWLFYAAFEEDTCQDVAAAQEVFEKALKIIPHETSFTFSKIWIAYAELHIRRRDIISARKLLGKALGKCPRKKIFKYYIGLEMQLGEMDRCRKIYER